MNIGEVYKTIEIISDSDNKRLLITNYLTSCLPILTGSKEYLDAVIHNIAGLLSTEYVQTLDADDQINDILITACEIEDQVDDKHEKLMLLISLIENLNKSQPTE